MSAIVISDAEQEALQGLPWIAQVLYLHLRKRMDFADGTVGVKRGAGISWKGLCEALYVEPHQGLSDTGAPHESSVRRALQWLVKVGLVQVRTVGTRLQFVLCMAITDDSAKRKPDRYPTGTRQSEPDREMVNGPGRKQRAFSNEVGRITDRYSVAAKEAQPDTHPGSGRDPLSPLSSAREAEQRAPAGRRFPMHCGWRPADDELNAYLQRVGISLESFSDGEMHDYLSEFKSYWMSRDRVATSSQWIQTLAARIKHLKTTEGRHAHRGRYRKEHFDPIGDELEALMRGGERIVNG